MAHVFCVANQKGGVGKTTTAVNAAAGLARLARRVLLIDLDAQGNATTGSGIEKSGLGNTVYDLLIGRMSFGECLLSSPSGYDILPANRELSAAEIDLLGMDNADYRLREILKSRLRDYDYVFIDCPPSLTLVTVNALCCAEGVIIPMQCEYFALEGLSDLINTVKRVRFNKNADLTMIALLRVMYDSRLTLQQQVSEQLKEAFGDRVFNVIIPRNVRLAEAPSHGKPGVIYDPSCRGSRAYLQFAEELLKRVGDFGFREAV